MLATDDYHHKRNKRSTGALTLWKMVMWESPAAVASSGNDSTQTHAHAEERASVKLDCVSGLGAVKGFSHFPDQPSTRCDWHK